jgi:N-acetylneuraminate synthase
MTVMEINLKNKKIGKNNHPFLIAEVAQAHEGSLGMAHSFIDAAADCGADAIKFQTHIASAESSKFEKFRTGGFFQDKTRFDYWKRMEFSHEQWKGLYDHAYDSGLIFISSPFSEEAVSLLDDIGVELFKIGSGDILNKVLIDSVIKTKKPILISSGLSSYEETDKLVDKLNKGKTEFGLFQCTSSYPCPPEEIGYNVLNKFLDRYNCPIGLSDHSSEIFPSLAAVSLGASIIEVHVTMSKNAFGPDTSSSLTFDQLLELKRGIDFIYRGLSVEIDKDKQAKERADVKKLFSRSAFYSRDLKKGQILKKDDFQMKKPGGGLDYNVALDMVGMELLKDVFAEDFLRNGDFR